MPFALTQFTVTIIEALIGALLLARIMGDPTRRAALLQQNLLPRWSLNGTEAGLLAITVFLLANVGQLAVFSLCDDYVKGSPNEPALKVVIYGFGFYGFGLLGWPAFNLLRRRLYSEYGSKADEVGTAPHSSSATHTLSSGVVTFFVAMPGIFLTGIASFLILTALGLPATPQDAVAVFGNVSSRPLMLAMLAVACVLAPIYEEMFFRGVLYRACRQRLGRPIALILSSVLFGILHTNAAGFLSLTLLGGVLAVAYEYTGDIRVPILAHGIFNLNTLVIVLSGLPQI
jgi:uncharacterized protein